MFCIQRFFNLTKYGNVMLKHRPYADCWPCRLRIYVIFIYFYLFIFFCHYFFTKFVSLGIKQSFYRYCGWFPTIFLVKPSWLMSVILILLQLFSFHIIPGLPRLAIALYLQCQDIPHVLWIPLPFRFSIFFFTPFGITGRVCKYIQFTHLMPNNNSKLLFFSTACYSKSLWLQKFWN